MITHYNVADPSTPSPNICSCGYIAEDGERWRAHVFEGNSVYQPHRYDGRLYPTLYERVTAVMERAGCLGSRP